MGFAAGVGDALLARRFVQILTNFADILFVDDVLEQRRGTTRVFRASDAIAVSAAVFVLDVDAELQAAEFMTVNRDENPLAVCLARHVSLLVGSVAARR